MFDLLVKEDIDLIDTVVASIGGTDGSSPSRKDVCKDRLFHIFSVTTQVPTSRQVDTYTLALRDHQAARGREEEAGGLWPMTWGWNSDDNWDRLYR